MFTLTRYIDPFVTLNAVLKSYLKYCFEIIFNLFSSASITLSSFSLTLLFNITIYRFYFTSYCQYKKKSLQVKILVDFFIVR